MPVRKDHDLIENPHQVYNNEARPLEQTGEPQIGSKRIKNENHTRAIKTREG